MAEGFGRWEADPLFPAAECVQDSADRYGLPLALLSRLDLLLGAGSRARLVAVASRDSWPFRGIRCLVQVLEPRDLV